MVTADFPLSVLRVCVICYLVWEDAEEGASRLLNSGAQAPSDSHLPTRPLACPQTGLVQLTARGNAQWRMSSHVLFKNKNLTQKIGSISFHWQDWVTCPPLTSHWQEKWGHQDWLELTRICTLRFCLKNEGTVMSLGAQSTASAVARSSGTGHTHGGETLIRTPFLKISFMFRIRNVRIIWHISLLGTKSVDSILQFQVTLRADRWPLYHPSYGGGKNKT